MPKKRRGWWPEEPKKDVSLAFQMYLIIKKKNSKGLAA
jgi:hypothetical protein